MRLAVCTLSAVLLSGCSWLGGLTGGGHHSPQAKSANYEYGGRYTSNQQHSAQNYGAQHNPCQIFSPQQPVPRGCDPASVTLGTQGAQYGGYPQQPNFGGGQGAYGGQYANQGYGSHAGVAGQQAANYNPRKQLRKPRWRGTMSMGIEKSYSGNLLDFTKVPTLDPVATYNPQNANQSIATGSEATGSITQTTWTANDAGRTDGLGSPLPANSIFTPNSYQRVSGSDTSFDDVYSTPLRIAGGLEYIFNPRTTLFANAGYSYSEGKSGKVASITGALYQYDSSQSYAPAGGGLFAPVGAPIETITNGERGQVITDYTYDFTDMARVDLEVGGRHYFNPIVKDQGFRTLTPFIGGSAGVSHYNATSANVAQRQLQYREAFQNTGTNPLYVTTNSRVDLYDSQWIPSGQLNAGIEWQLTPKTAMAFETGVRIEGAREYSNGTKGSTNVAVPLTIRGSYNF